MAEAVNGRRPLWFWLTTGMTFVGAAATIVSLVLNPVGWAPLSMIYVVAVILYAYQVRLPAQAKFLLQILFVLGCLWTIANVFFGLGR